jgi:hypothetical protein
MVQRTLGAVGARVLAFDEARNEFTRSYVAQLQQLARDNVSQAARLARCNRTDKSGRSTCGRAAPSATQLAAAKWD